VQTIAIVAISTPVTDEGDISSNPSGHVVGHSRGFFHGTQNAVDNVLGHNLLYRTIATLDNCGVARTTAVPQSPGFRQLSAPPTGDGPFPAWERAIARAVQQGARNILLLRANEYVELDFSELIRVHTERGAALTQVCTEDGGPLDIVIVDAEKLRMSNDESFRARLTALSQRKQRFYYQGYVNRLQKPADYMGLIQDALCNRCKLRPVGTEIKSGIWMGGGARIDDSCVVIGPCFIGAETRVGACCTVGSGSAIERGCDVDSGTAIEHSWILSGTYVGVGLNVRHSIVRNSKMFHLDRRTEVTVSDRRLIGATRARTFFGLGTGFLSKLQFDGVNR